MGSDERSINPELIIALCMDDNAVSTRRRSFAWGHFDDPHQLASSDTETQCEVGNMIIRIGAGPNEAMLIHVTSLAAQSF